MADEVERDTTQGASPVAVIETVPVDDTPMWTIRVTVAMPFGPTRGWVPYVFWSEEAAETWISGRVRGRIVPSVRDCIDGSDDLGIACISTEDGIDLVLSEPLTRVRAPGVAATFARELRAHQPPG